MIHLVDSTTIRLVANCLDWAKHRRRKAAVKCHLRLNLQSFLPRFAIVDTARYSDAKKADVTGGDNEAVPPGGGYSAAPGWDACTGLGSPNGSALLAGL